MTSENNLPSSVSRLLSHVLFPVSRLLSSVSLPLFPFSCLPSPTPVYHLLSPVSQLLLPVSCLPSPTPVSCLPSPVSQLLPLVSCLLSPVYCLMSTVSFLPSLVSRLPSPVSRSRYSFQKLKRYRYNTTVQCTADMVATYAPDSGVPNTCCVFSAKSHS